VCNRAIETSQGGNLLAPARRYEVLDLRDLRTSIRYSNAVHRQGLMRAGEKWART
jgi:hypothetical protein